MSRERQLWIFYDNRQSLKYQRLSEILKRNEIRLGLKDRNMKVYRKKNPDNKFTIALVGYDGKIKYTTSKVSIKEMMYIFAKVDRMPMRKDEIRRKMAKKKRQ